MKKPLPQSVANDIADTETTAAEIELRNRILKKILPQAMQLLTGDVRSLGGDHINILALLPAVIAGVLFDLYEEPAIAGILDNLKPLVLEEYKNFQDIRFPDEPDSNEPNSTTH